MTSPAQILALQRTVGNRAVQRLLAKNQPVSQPARSAAQPTVSLAPSVPGPATPIRRSTLGPRIQRFIGKDKDGGTAIRVSDGAKFSIFFDREEDDIHYYNLAGLTTSEFFDNVPEDTDEFDLPGAVVATPTTFVPKPSKYESLDDFEGPPSNENQARKQQLLITYIDNLILAGLPQKKVVRAATAALNQKGGWKHADIDTITEVFAEGLQSDIDDVSRALLKACFTETPNEEDLQRWALEREPEAVEEAFELEDEAAFVDDTAQHFLGDGEQFKKLWRTATPGQKQLIHSLMTADEEALPLSRIGYLVEAIDLPRHRSGLDPQVASWGNSSAEKLFFDYLDAHPPENLRSINYYSHAEKEEHRLGHGPSLFFSRG